MKDRKKVVIALLIAVIIAILLFVLLRPKPVCVDQGSDPTESEATLITHEDGFQAWNWDYCEGTTLVQTSCAQGGRSRELAEQRIECPNGCDQGACLS